MFDVLLEHALELVSAGYTNPEAIEQLRSSRAKPDSVRRNAQSDSSALDSRLPAQQSAAMT